MSYVDRIVAKNDRRIREGRLAMQDAESFAGRSTYVYDGNDLGDDCRNCRASRKVHIANRAHADAPGFCPEWALREAYGR